MPSILSGNVDENVANVDNDEEEEDTTPGPQMDMLHQLTGQPVVEDELLFVVPVIAPYNAVGSYK